MIRDADGNGLPCHSRDFLDRSIGAKFVQELGLIPGCGVAGGHGVNLGRVGLRDATLTKDPTMTDHETDLRDLLTKGTDEPRRVCRKSQLLRDWES